MSDDTLIGPRPRHDSLERLRAAASAEGAPRSGRLLAIMAEWSVGCTCAHPDRPWECLPCTAAAIAAIEKDFST